MIFKETGLQGAYSIELERISDTRGFFARTWCSKEFDAKKLETQFVQANVAYNNQKNILRGMHRQIAPHEEIKLVRCTKGSVFDVIVDLRKDSATFKQWFGIELNEENHTMLYIPKGFAHGYQTLTDEAELFYQVSEFYSPEHERGVRWNDPAFNIQWPKDTGHIISAKDQAWPDFE